VTQGRIHDFKLLALSLVRIPTPKAA
jgi:hypothetical protein